MLTAIASAISVSLCGVLNTHRVCGLAGSTMRPDAAIEIIGTCASATTSTMASELGVTVEPMITSTLSSVISLRVLVTALVVSEPSSRITQLIFCPPIDRGRSSKVLLSGMPSEAAGPVADSVTPIVMSACATAATIAAATATASWMQRFISTPPMRVARRLDLPPRRGHRWCAAQGAVRHFFSESRIWRNSRMSSGVAGAAAAGGSSSFFIALNFLIIRKITSARITKLRTTVRKLP